VSKPSSQGLRQIDRVKGDAPEKPKSTIDYEALIESAESVAAAGDLVPRALANSSRPRCLCQRKTLKSITRSTLMV